MRILESGRTILSLTFTSDSQSLFTAGWKHVSRWDLQTGIEREFASARIHRFAQGVAVSPSGSMVAWNESSNRNQEVCHLIPLWPSRGRQFFETGRGYIWGQRGNHGFLADDQFLVLVNHRLVATNLKGEQQAWLPLLPGGSLIAVCPLGRRVAVAEGEILRLWSSDQLPSGALIQREPIPFLRPSSGQWQTLTLDPTQTIRELAFSSTDRLWIRTPGGISILDVEPLGVFRRIPPLPIRPLGITPNGRTLLGQDGSYELVVYDLIHEAEVTRYVWNIGTVDAVAIAPDGLTVAAAGLAGEIALFDLE